MVAPTTPHPCFRVLQQHVEPPSRLQQQPQQGPEASVNGGSEGSECSSSEAELEVAAPAAATQTPAEPALVPDGATQGGRIAEQESRRQLAAAVEAVEEQLYFALAHPLLLTTIVRRWEARLAAWHRARAQWA